MVQDTDILIKCFWCGKILEPILINEKDWVPGIKRIYRTHECPDVHCSIEFDYDKKDIEAFPRFRR